ncbi:MAG: glycosyltransferase [Thermoanaerobaculia bacterium]|nr:glycosyltransferase [Thermoanaerobaculia bacterium]
MSGFAALRERLEAVLVLVGDGPDLQPGLRLAESLGVGGDVRALGKLEQLEGILQASDLFFLPSRAESFGLSALEAQACGCPVIGYRAGGLPEVVVDGVTGLLCPEGEDVCLGSVAAGLLADRPRYLAMRRAAREHAEQFAADPIVDRYEEALCCLIHDGACSRAEVARRLCPAASAPDDRARTAAVCRTASGGTE